MGTKKRNVLLQAVNPLTPRVELWVIQSFLTFDSMDRALKYDHSLKNCTLPWCCLFFFFVLFYPVCNLILENLSSLDLTLSGVKGLKASVIMRLRH